MLSTSMNISQGFMVAKMAIKEVGFEIERLSAMKSQLKNLYYIGDTKLLNKPSVAIVGARKANQYSKQLTFQLASELSKRGVVVISGAAMGIDAMAHKGAGADNTIAVVANGLDIRYPKVNEPLIKEIERNGLVMSQFQEGFQATKWSFPVRNELVVALADSVVIAQADIKSGSMVSAQIAKDQGKEIFVFPHRLGESSGTDALVQEGSAKVIYDINQFCNQYGIVAQDSESIEIAENAISYEDAVAKYGDKLFEYELEGKVVVKEGMVFRV